MPLLTRCTVRVRARTARPRAPLPGPMP